MTHVLAIRLEKSDAMVHGPNLDQPAKYELTEREIEIDLPDGPWVQFTYGWLEVQGLFSPTFKIYHHDGFWWTADDVQPWSDMVLRITPKET